MSVTSGHVLIMEPVSILWMHSAAHALQVIIQSHVLHSKLTLFETCNLMVPVGKMSFQECDVFLKCTKLQLFTSFMIYLNIFETCGGRLHWGDLWDQHRCLSAWPWAGSMCQWRFLCGWWHRTRIHLSVCSRLFRSALLQVYVIHNMVKLKKKKKVFLI